MTGPKNRVSPGVKSRRSWLALMRAFHAAEARRDAALDPIVGAVYAAHGRRLAVLAARTRDGGQWPRAWSR